MLFWHSNTRMTLAFDDSVERSFCSSINIPSSSGIIATYPRFAALRSSNGMPANTELAARKARLTKLQNRFTQAQTAISEKPHKIGAILTDAHRPSGFPRQISGTLHATATPVASLEFAFEKIRRGISEARTVIHRFCEHASQRADRIVHYRRGILFLKSNQPLLTIALAYLTHIRSEKRRPRTIDEIINPS